MTARGGMAIASAVVATAVAVALASSGRAVSAAERPRGAVENCSTSAGWPSGSVRELTSRRNLAVGPLALENAGVMLEYAENVGGNKLLVHVRGGHRVTLELSRETRMDVGFAFGSPLRATKASKWNLRNARRIVTFRACERGESSGSSDYDEWPVSGWVGWLLARSPRCVPLLIWVDDEPSPRSETVRFGVKSC